jgi:hypothetical protein
MFKRTAIVIAAVLCVVGTRDLRAQAQENSIQASATALIVRSNYTVGGGELQYRRTFSAWSLGGGIQYFYDPTTVCATTTSCTKAGGTSVFFIEPRYVVAHSDKSALYLAGRVAYSNNSGSSGTVFGGGGGLMQVLTDAVSLDLGAQVYTSSSSSTTIQLRAGLSFGF